MTFAKQLTVVLKLIFYVEVTCQVLFHEPYIYIDSIPVLQLGDGRHGAVKSLVQAHTANKSVVQDFRPGSLP